MNTSLSHVSANGMEDNSVTRSFRMVAAGNGDAAQLLWDRYFPRLVGFARSRNASLPAGIVDEEDIALSTLNSVCIGLRNGRFPDLQDRESLWRLLIVIATRKSADQVAYEMRVKRDANRTRSVQGMTAGTGDLEGGDRPESTVDYEDMLHHLIEQLRHDDLKEVALLKLDGHKNSEIADKIGRSVATVERKLKTIRTIWDEVG